MQTRKHTLKMRQISKHNKYYDSDGNAYTQSQVNSNISAAKAQKIDDMNLEHGFVYCQEDGCGKNANAGEPLDCSHDISVLEAKNTRRVELAWDVENITIRCRTCHRKHDKTL